MSEITKEENIAIEAHQLKTNLGAAKWVLKMMEDGDTGALTEEQRGLINKLYKNNEDMLAQVGKMLAISRDGEKSEEYNFTSVDLIKITDDVLFAFREQILKRQIEVIFIRPEENMLAKADAKKIHIVIQNLIENAIKYGSEKGKIFISARKIDNTVEMAVKDSGLKISESDQPNIFEKYFRGEKGLANETSTGLGLYITKNIIENHGGKIWFESTDSSTTFYFTLPAMV